MIFPEALESADEFARFAQAVNAPLLANMTEFGRSPLLPFDELAGLGYKAVIYPLTAFRAAMRAAQEVLETLRDKGTQQGLLETMQTRAELYDLLGYNDWEERDRGYFTPNSGGEGIHRLVIRCLRSTSGWPERAQGLDGRDVQQRADLEFRGHAVVGDIDAHEDARSG